MYSCGRLRGKNILKDLVKRVESEQDSDIGDGAFLDIAPTRSLDLYPHLFLPARASAALTLLRAMIDD